MQQAKTIKSPADTREGRTYSRMEPRFQTPKAPDYWCMKISVAHFRMVWVNNIKEILSISMLLELILLYVEWSTMM